MLALLPVLLFPAIVPPLAPSKGDSQPALPPPIAMPADRAAVSYQIYSMLMPIGETGLPMWPHDFWLLQDTTIDVVRAKDPCVPARNAPEFEMNPHIAVHSGPGGREDFKEILQDFDKHCHDRIALDSSKLKTRVPVRLANEDEQNEFRRFRGEGQSDPVLIRKYKGAPALYAFSEVYFNARSTVALVYATQWCGNLCAQGMWIAFALRDGKWQPLRWGSDSWIS